MTRAALQVSVSADSDELAAAVADRTVAALALAQADRGRAALVVTGGSILDKVLGRLAGATEGTDLDWGLVDIWWGDERFVRADSADRNDTEAMRAGLGALPLDPARIHAMPVSGGAYGEDVDAAAAAYAQELAAVALIDPGASDGLPRLDVALMGVGPDGHCASLFPGHPALTERTLTTVAVRNSPKPPPVRTSLTFRALDSVDRVWFVVSSADKAPAVASAVGGADAQQTPSAEPRGRIETVWMVDSAAAALLPDPQN
jgi:6-phosphogluconolactonase